MKIVHLFPEINKGGTERIVLTLAQIQKEKHDVQIIVFSEKNLYPHLTKGLKINVIKSQMLIEYGILGVKRRNVKELETLLSEMTPNVIHSHSLWTDQLLHQIPVLNSKYFSHLHLYYDNFFTPPSSFTKHKFTTIIDRSRYYWKCNQRKTTFIAVSKSVFNYYYSKYPKYLKARFVQLDNCINLSEFFASESKGKPIAPYKLLSVGRLVPVKNQKFLISVCERLSQSNFPFAMNLIGDGPLKEELQHEIDRKGLADKITLQGNRENIKDFYSSSDLYIHSAIKEPFGLSILESLASGTPCIALKAGGNEELITNNYNGFLAEPNVDIFASLITKVFTDSKLYNSLQENTIDSTKQFDINMYAQKIEKLYMLKT